jgi:hypothetical protein
VKRLCIVALIAGCSRSSDGQTQPPPPAPAPAPSPAPAGYAADIGRLCDAVKLSNADAEPGGRQVKIAMWLGENLKTTEAHQFLVTIQPLEGPAKADALLAEAKKVGLADCPLAAEWR